MKEGQEFVVGAFGLFGSFAGEHGTDFVAQANEQHAEADEPDSDQRVEAVKDPQNAQTNEEQKRRQEQPVAVAENAVDIDDVRLEALDQSLEVGLDQQLRLERLDLAEHDMEDPDLGANRQLETFFGGVLIDPNLHNSDQKQSRNIGIHTRLLWG